MRTIAQACAPGRRCMDWRRCPYCAGVRQKQIADKAERMEARFPRLFLSVIKPLDNTGHAITKLRAAILRRAFAPAGLWSVESGEKMGGLHLNIIAPAPVLKSVQGCTTWAEALTTSARAAAAYINKPGSFPDRAEYSGNLTGSWSRIPDLFADVHMPPTVQAASAEYALAGKTPEHYARLAEASRATRDPAQHLTRDEYREIARRNLPNLYAMFEKAADDAT